MKILTCAGNTQTAKSYPHWNQLLLLLKDHEIQQITGILSEAALLESVHWADVVITIDSFLPHLIKYYKIRKTIIVIWSKSDPNIFGYAENINLLKDRKYLKPEQFKWWMDEPHDPAAFVSPEEIAQVIESISNE
jgi:ADP-heptose:LPS heptosyltransferase